MRARPARLDRLPEQYFTALLARVAAAAAHDGEPLVDLGRGNPDVPPPRHVVEALYASAGRTDTHGYAPFAGVPALRLLEENRVAVAPGEGFGERGRRWARLSLATPDDRLDLGLGRLSDALR